MEHLPGSDFETPTRYFVTVGAGGQPGADLFEWQEGIEELQARQHHQGCESTFKSGGDVVLVKSDSCVIRIPSLDIEIPSGRGRYSPLSEFLSETADQIEIAVARFGGRPPSLDALRDPTAVLTILLDDPLDRSWVEGTQVETRRYLLSLDQALEYDLFSPDPAQETDLSALETMRALVQTSRRIVAFTGAGVSVESGLPAFRMSGRTDNIWDQYSAEDHHVSRWNQPDTWARAWEMHDAFFTQLQSAKPNAAHDFLKNLQDQGRLSSVITQNIDGLHQAAGVENVIELHGTLWREKCLDCGAKHQRQPNTTSAHACSCGGRLRPDCVSFGEGIPIETLEAATSQIRSCDLLLVIGSSLSVSPANNLPMGALWRKVPLAVLNIEQTMYDDYAACVVREPCAAFLATL